MAIWAETESKLSWSIDPKEPSLYYVSKWTGWVGGSEKLQFLLMFSTMYADIGRVGGSEKVQKFADVI